MRFNACVFYGLVAASLVIISSLLFAENSYSDVYKYKDSEGNVHYVDDYFKIPEQFRDTVVAPHKLPEIIRDPSRSEKADAAKPSSQKAEEEFDKYLAEVTKFTPTPIGGSTQDTVVFDNNMTREEIDEAQQALTFVRKFLTGPVLLFFIAIIVIYIICGWILLSRAGMPGFGILVPIYNGVLLSRLGGFSGWWILWMFVPIIGSMIWSTTINFGTAKRFGRSTGFAIGTALLPFIFIPIIVLDGSEPEF